MNGNGIRFSSDKLTQNRYFFITNLYILLLLIFLLAPFDFQAPFTFGKNNVKWISQTNGVKFSSAGIIRSPSSSSLDKLYEKLTSGTGITLEVWTATEHSRQEGPARIVSYSVDKTSRNFTLGQDQHDLVIRLRTTKTNLNGKNPQVIVNDIFNTKNPQHIVTTYDFSEEIIYLNGQVQLRVPIPGGNFSNWDPSYPLVLGNEVTGNRPWLGKLFLVAIYDRALSEREVQKNYAAGWVFKSKRRLSDRRVQDGLVVHYLFTKGEGERIFDRSEKFLPVHLHIPKILLVIDKIFLTSPYWDFATSRLETTEIIGNIIIFVPFGFLFYTTIGRRFRSPLAAITLVFTIGTLFTFSVESLQFFLETRNSSMTDIINNMVGTVMGATVAAHIHKKWITQ